MSCMGLVIKHRDKSTERLSNVLICFGLCRRILITLIVWLLTLKKSEYIYWWRNCQVGVSVLHIDATNILFVKVFYRAEFRLTGGDLSTFCLLPWPQRTQGDIWRFQRKSQVRAWLLYVIHLYFLFNEWTVPCKPSWRRRKYLLWLLWVNNHERIEMDESYTESCRQKMQGWVRGTVGGSKQELLGKLLLYFVFHRHCSKSDQGHRRQQHPRSLPPVVLHSMICSSYN